MNRISIILIAIVLKAASYANAGGFILVNQPASRTGNPGIQQFALECRELKVSVDIHCLMAQTLIEQVFVNNTDLRLEGYFYFPVPKGSVINQFQMDVNGVMTDAELLDAGKARQIYEDIVRSMKDPALLEYAEQDLFRVRIFPIEPRSTKQIRISYREMITADNGTCMYRFPMNTKKYASAPVREVLFNLNIRCEEEIKNMFSPTHDLLVERKGAGKASATFSSKNYSPDTDLKFCYQTGNSMLGISCLSYQSGGEDGFFYLDINPGFLKKEQVLPKDVTFVLDVSGSMNGEKMQQAKNALAYCVDHLHEGDRFEIIRFSTEARSLFGKRTAVSETSRSAAHQFIQSLRAIGGTNMDEAFQLALKEKPENSRPSMVIFITDGKPTIGETEQNTLVKKIGSMNQGKHRIFTLGIGHDLNSKLLDLITEEGKGTRTYVGENEDIEREVAGFFEKVNAPIASDIKISFSQGNEVFDMFPKQVPDLFSGNSITLFGRFSKPGKHTITIEGTINGSRRTFQIPVEMKNDPRNEYIAPLWASRHVGYLLEQIRLHGETKELKDEVVLLAKQYGIITPYTSYLIIEDERQLTRTQQVPMPIFSNRSDADVLSDRSREEYRKMQQAEGKGSIESSKDLQNMNRTANQAQASMNKEAMTVVSESGEKTNLAHDTRNVAGRAWYFSNGTWNDIQLQKKKTDKTVVISFGSKEYFDFARKYPETNQILALGKNVRFVLGNICVEVKE